MVGSLPRAGSLSLALTHSCWLTILLSPFTRSPTSFLLTFLLSVVIFTSSGINVHAHSCVCARVAPLPTLLPHTLFFLYLFFSFSCSPLKSWVEKAGPHGQGVAPERVLGSQGRSIRPGDGQGLGMSAFSRQIPKAPVVSA